MANRLSVAVCKRRRSGVLCGGLTGKKEEVQFFKQKQGVSHGTRSTEDGRFLEALKTDGVLRDPS